MRVNNYKKNGEVFSASLSVYPVYDSLGSGVDDEPILTHFATVLTRVERLDAKDAAPVLPRSVANCLTELGGPGAGLAAAAPSVGLGPAAWLDRRKRCRRFDMALTLAPDSFVTVCAAARLSDLLRLMLSTNDAMVLADAEVGLMDSQEISLSPFPPFPPFPPSPPHPPHTTSLNRVHPNQPPTYPSFRGASCT